jgi:predicted mannosyl-3-phosphoglycerate phosphatase (HAD superfamily)
MTDKIKGLERLTRAMAAKARAADMQLAVLKQRLRTLDEAQLRLMEALNRDMIFQGDLARSAIKRLEGMRRQRTQLAYEHERLALEALVFRRDLKRCEHLELRERSEAAKIWEARQLEENIGQFLLRANED